MPAYLKRMSFLFFILTLSYLPDAFAQSSNLDFSEMAGDIERFEAGWRDLNRSMQDMPLQLIDYRNHYLHRWQDTLQSISFDQLSQEGKVDDILLQYTIHKQLFENEQQLQVWEAIRKLLPLTDSILLVAEKRHEGDRLNPEWTAGIFHQFADQLQRRSQHIYPATLPDAHLSYPVLQAMQHLHAIIKGIYDFYNLYDPAFTWWMQTTYRRTDSLFTVYTDSLRVAIMRQLNAHDRSGIHGSPIGRDALVRLLHDEMIPYTPEELIDIANREYNWCLQQIKKPPQPWDMVMTGKLHWKR